MGKKKATVGERIELNGVREALCRWNLTLDDFRTAAVYVIPRKRAKAIDRAIRKAAKDERRAIHAAIFNSFTAQGRPKEQRQAAAAIMAMIRRMGV